MTGPRILGCGGRDYCDRKWIAAHLDAFRAQYGASVICTGGARGADTLIDDWAVNHRIDRVVHPAEWDRYGKAAGAIRNVKMLQSFKPDVVIAFPGGNGTEHMVKISREAGVPVWCVAARIT